MPKIELEKRESGWFVRWGDVSQDRLTLDEALGTVASIMFTGRAPYLRTDLENFLWKFKYGDLEPLLTDGRSHAS